MKNHQHSISQNPTNNQDTHFQLSFKKRHKRLAYGKNYIPEEETIRNDYSLHYVLTGSRPQNQIQNTALSTRFAEYPKLKKLLELKKSQVSEYSHPPMYIQADLRPPPYPNSFNLLELLPTRFDVIVIDPPLKEYMERYPNVIQSNPNLSKSGGPLNQERAYWNWDELENLPIPSIAASPGFIFLWCGSGQGSTLEFGRSLLSKWGYRKCEDLVWIKTNHNQLDKNVSNNLNSNFIQSDENHQDSNFPAIFTSTKEHCLMGIRGTVRRSTDGHFVHCNVDTDVMVSEPDPTDVLHKPEELYQLIENFCLGRRKLDLFGSRKTLRPGWLTIGNDCKPTSSFTNDLDSNQTTNDKSPIPYQKSRYLNFFLHNSGRTQNLLPTNNDIDNLRPRSPPSRIAPAITNTGIPLTHGRGYLSGSMPLIGPDGTVLGNTISGRNTISHPSGGLGRGPGNALLPGMRVSGLRDSNHPANINQHKNLRSVSQIGHSNPSFSLPIAFFNSSLTPLQPPTSSYPFSQPSYQQHTPTSPYHPMLYGPHPTYPIHQHVTTTPHTSYSTSHLPPPHQPFYYPTHSLIPPPSTHSAHQYNPYHFFQGPNYHHEHPFVGHTNHNHQDRNQFLNPHSFPNHYPYPSTPDTSNHHQSRLLSNVNTNANPNISLNPSSTSPLPYPTTTTFF